MDVKAYEFAKAHLPPFSVLGHKKGKIRAFEKSSTGEKGELLLEAKREKILWVETPKGKSLLGRSVLELEEEEEEEKEKDFEKRNGFHQSHFLVFFSFFMVIFSPSMN